MNNNNKKHKHIFIIIVLLKRYVKFLDCQLKKIRDFQQL